VSKTAVGASEASLTHAVTYDASTTKHTRLQPNPNLSLADRPGTARMAGAGSVGSAAA